MEDKKDYNVGLFYIDLLTNDNLFNKPPNSNKDKNNKDKKISGKNDNISNKNNNNFFNINNFGSFNIISQGKQPKTL